MKDWNSKVKALLMFSIAALLVLLGELGAQKIEVVDGVRVVHNKKPGLWGKKPAVKMELVRKLGDIDSTDPNTAFYMPSAVAVDSAGNIYVLDTGNNRIQKFSRDGKYLATIGRFGQGPGEFNYPTWFDIDRAGNLYVTDPFNDRVQVLNADGQEVRTIKFSDGQIGNVFVRTDGKLVMGQATISFRFVIPGEEKPAALPKIVKILDGGGKVLSEFGDRLDLKDELLNNTVNQAIFTVDDRDNVYLAFPYQNRIEKYSPDGKLLWRADRELSYSLEVQDKGSIERRGGGVSIRSPRINRSSEALAVDGKGRVWVVTLARQLKKEEQVGIGVTISQSASGGRQVGFKPQGDIDLRETDAYKLEVFDSEGRLLGEISLSQFVDVIFIYGDRLFLVDRLRGASIQEFLIRE
ncbi:MAG: 6-bladed beta-propeller [Candidatus Saccharicenans sp.]|uniref:6-bladed beta-propeller n=1 Tax=Candidatus Saccharicenans sp. TaxID=2819258 RepID=UPI0040490FCB